MTQNSSGEKNMNKGRHRTKRKKKNYTTFDEISTFLCWITSISNV